MRQPTLQNLGRRERQIMEAVIRRGRATVNEVLDELPDPPSYSAVRAMLGKLEHKGYLSHDQQGPRYVYLPAVSTETARRSALEHLVNTFFEGSTDQAVLALVRMSDAAISDRALTRLAREIQQAREEGR